MAPCAAASRGEVVEVDKDKPNQTLFGFIGICLGSSLTATNRRVSGPPRSGRSRDVVRPGSSWEKADTPKTSTGRLTPPCPSAHSTGWWYNQLVRLPERRGSKLFLLNFKMVKSEIAEIKGKYTTLGLSNTNSSRFKKYFPINRSQSQLTVTYGYSFHFSVNDLFLIFSPSSDCWP